MGRTLREWAVSALAVVLPFLLSSLVYSRVGQKEGFWTFILIWSLEVGLLLRLLWVSRPRELFK